MSAAKARRPNRPVRPVRPGSPGRTARPGAAPSASPEPPRPGPRARGLDRYFQISARGSSVASEIRGGFATFFTMAYIVVLNPLILGTAPDVTGDVLGIPFVATATALVAGVLTIATGLYARYPFTTAAGGTYPRHPRPGRLGVGVGPPTRRGRSAWRPAPAARSKNGGAVENRRRGRYSDRTGKCRPRRHLSLIHI